jgi:hypothetical protein
MLNPEIAQARLKEYKVDDWLATRLKQLVKLAPALRQIGFGVLGYDEQSQQIKVNNAAVIIEQRIQELGALKAADRLKIFQIIFPKFPDILELTWQRFQGFTYRDGYGERAIRVTDQLEQAETNRSWWFQALVQLVQGYDGDLVWLASWCPYLGYRGDMLDHLFAAAIDSNEAVGNEVFDILIASAKGEHEIGAMGRHITHTLLLADRPAGWEFTEKLLLAAQRQEGLRQSILSSVYEAHPQAFQRMISLIISEDLIRFTAVLQSINSWIGFPTEALTEKQARQVVGEILELFGDSQKQQTALASDDAQTVYLALWVIGFTDNIRAIELTRPLLQHTEASHRFVAIYFLNRQSINLAKYVLMEAIVDPDMRVACMAIQGLWNPDRALLVAVPDSFEKIAALFPQWPVKETVLPPIVWDWCKQTAQQQNLAQILVNHVGQRSPKVLIPYLAVGDVHMRANISRLLAAVKPWDAEIRNALFGLVSDASSWLRQEVIGHLMACEIDSSESAYLVTLLTRKASDLRRGILNLLLKQTDTLAIEAATSLIGAKDVLQRQAGLELLAELVKQNRLVDRARQITQAYQTKRGDKITNPEKLLIDHIFVTEIQQPTLKDALGLVNLSDLSQFAAPVSDQPLALNTAAVKSTLAAIDELIHEHRQTPVQITDWQGQVAEHLLGNVVPWQFPAVDNKLSAAENLSRLPLADVWQNWYQGQRAKDEDGLELMRAISPRYAHILHHSTSVNSNDSIGIIF